MVVSCGGQQRHISPPSFPDAGGGPARELSQDEIQGEASWYGERFQGRSTANGEPFDMYLFTAAHKTLPFGTVVRVIRDDTLQSVVVRINDRGPYSEGRIIDLAWAAAVDLNLVDAGHLSVHLEILEWGP